MEDQGPDDLENEEREEEEDEIDEEVIESRKRIQMAIDSLIDQGGLSPPVGEYVRQCKKDLPQLYEKAERSLRLKKDLLAALPKATDQVKDAMYALCHNEGDEDVRWVLDMFEAMVGQMAEMIEVKIKST